MSEKETNNVENEKVEDVKTKEEAVATAPNKEEEAAPVKEAVKEVEESPKQEKVNEIVAPEDFDWDMLNNKEDSYKADERKKLEAIYDETLNTVVENEVINGKVVAINKREVVVNIGYKSEGIINANEFRYNQELKVGDEVEVLVETQEDNNGQLIVSHKRARSMRSWDRVNEALEKDEIIKGFI